MILSIVGGWLIPVIHECALVIGGVGDAREPVCKLHEKKVDAATLRLYRQDSEMDFTYLVGDVGIGRGVFEVLNLSPFACLASCLRFNK
jgi:hypothetical protein